MPSVARVPAQASAVQFRSHVELKQTLSHRSTNSGSVVADFERGIRRVDSHLDVSCALVRRGQCLFDIFHQVDENLRQLMLVSAGGGPNAAEGQGGGTVSGSADSGFVFPGDVFSRLGTTSAGSDFPRDLVFDSSGNLFLSGATQRSLEGVNQGGYDVFLSKFSPNGAVLWTRQFGSVMTDTVNALAVAPDGTAVVSGYLATALEGTVIQANFVAKFSAAGDRL